MEMICTKSVQYTLGLDIKSVLIKCYNIYTVFIRNEEQHA